MIGGDAHFIVMGVGDVSCVYRSTDDGLSFEEMDKITQFGAAGALAVGEGIVYGAINYGNAAPEIHTSDDGAVTWNDGVEVTTPKNTLSMTAHDVP